MISKVRYNDNMENNQRVTLIRPRLLIDAVKLLAQRHRRSFVGEVIWALQQYVAHDEREAPHGDDPQDL